MSASSIQQKISRGVSLIEMVVVSAVLGTTFLLVIGGTRTSMELSILAVEKSQSASLIEEGAEVVRFLRDSAWTNISSKTISTIYYPTWSGGTWTLSTTPNTIDGFTRQVVFSNAYRDGSNKLATSGTLDSNIRKVTVTTTWTSNSGPQSDSMSFYISNLF